MSRPAATSPDAYTLTIEETAVRYEHAGHPRTIRSIQRYCAQGHLDCLRQQTTYGDKYMITPESVARHIAQIAELASATGRDETRHVATGRSSETTPEPSDDRPRQDATGRDVSPPAGERGREVAPQISDRYVARLEDEVIFLRDQITKKDTQIAEQSVRAGETNILIKGLQELVLALQPGRSDTAHNAPPGQ